MTETISVEQFRELVKNNHHGKSKFHNIAVVKSDGQHLDSIKEGKRYDVLRFLESKGIISNLECHVVFDIAVNNMPICRYEADFVYRTADGEKPIGNRLSHQVVEDVKGYKIKKWVDENGKKRTTSNPAYRLFQIKKKLMKAVLNIDVIES